MIDDTHANELTPIIILISCNFAAQNLSQIIRFFTTKLNNKIMQSIDDKILANMRKCGRGKVYFVADFALYGEANSAHKCKCIFRSRKNL